MTRATGNLHPEAGLAEIDYDLKATDSAVTGSAMYRFYKSDGGAARYFKDTDSSSFVGQTKAKWSGEIHMGLIKDPDDPEDVTHVLWAIDAKDGIERIRLGFQDDGLVGTVSFVLPRPGVQATDDIRQETIDAAAQALTQLELDETSSG